VSERLCASADVCSPYASAAVRLLRSYPLPPFLEVVMGPVCTVYMSLVDDGASQGRPVELSPSARKRKTSQ
jgi:hypothetical protein